MSIPFPSKTAALRLFLVLGVFAGCWGVLAGAVLGQNAQPQQITFQEAVQIALEQNLTLQRTANTVELQAIDVSRQRMNFFPALNFSSGAGRNYGRNFNTDEGRIVDQTTTGIDAGVSTSVNLFNGFGDVASLRQAQLGLEATDYDYDWQRQTVVFTVISNFLTLIAQQEQIRVQEENVESQRQQLAQIEEFTRVGSRPISDLYQQQAQAANAELTLLQAQRAFQLSEISLIQTLKLDPFREYEFVAPEVQEANLTEEDYNVSELLRNAFEQRVDLRARELEIEAAEQGVKVSRSDFWPSISFSGNYGSSYTDANSLSNFSDQFTNQNRRGSIGLSLNFPIFDRLQRNNNVQLAKVNLNNARLDLENTRQDIALQVRQAYLDYLTLEKGLDVAQRQVQAAQQALDAEQERYNVGAATLVELSIARANAVEALSSQVQAKYDFIFQKKLIDYYLGRLNPNESITQ